MFFFVVLFLWFFSFGVKAHTTYTKNILKQQHTSEYILWQTLLFVDIMLTYLLGYNPPLMFVCCCCCGGGVFLFVFELKKQTFLTSLLHISQSRAIFRSAVYFLQVQFWRLFSHLHSFVNVFWMILWSIESTIGRPMAYRFRLTVRQ